MGNLKDSIIVNGKQHFFVADKNEHREFCSICSLKEICFEKMIADTMLCRVHLDKEKGIVNGYYKLEE